MKVTLKNPRLFICGGKLSYLDEEASNVELDKGNGWTNDVVVLLAIDQINTTSWWVFFVGVHVCRKKITFDMNAHS
jgi:hypothetical protein